MEGGKKGNKRGVGLCVWRGMRTYQLSQRDRRSYSLSEAIKLKELDDDCCAYVPVTVILLHIPPYTLCSIPCDLHLVSVAVRSQQGWQLEGR